MAKKNAKTVEDRFAQSWRLPLARALMAVALAMSAYLLYVSLTNGAAAGCGPDSACDRVLKSRWAYWFGLPVSLPALLVYAGLLGGSFALTHKSPATRRQAWRWMYLGALLVAGAATWFVLLMVFAIKGICPFCLAAHAAGLTAAILILLNAPIRPIPELAWQIEKQIYLPPNRARQALYLAAAGWIALAGGQFLHKKQTHIVKALPSITNVPLPQASPPTNSGYKVLGSAKFADSSTNPVTVQPLLSNLPPAPPPVTTNPTPQATPPTNPPVLRPPLRVLTSHGGQFQYNVQELPLMGSPDATHVIVSLFDYTCHHCHIMHGHLVEAMRQFSNSLAVISLPMPLDAECNPMVSRTHRTASNACHYARLGLAVWRADRAQFPKFEEFMWAKETPPPIMDATSFAGNLVGMDKLSRALGDPWISDQIKRNIAIYRTNYQTLGTGSMPQLIIGQNATAGSFNSANDLIKLLRERLPRR